MLQNVKFNSNNEVAISVMEYLAIVERPIDGDGVALNIDLGIGLSFSQDSQDTSSRLLFVHALEKTKHRGQSEDEKQLGIKAFEILSEYLTPGKKVIIQMVRADKNQDVYGRYLVKIFIPELGNEVSLNEHLLKEYGAPMFLTAEQDDAMIANREVKKGISIRKRVSK